MIQVQNTSEQVLSFFGLFFFCLDFPPMSGDVCFFMFPNKQKLIAKGWRCMFPFPYQFEVDF